MEHKPLTNPYDSSTPEWQLFENMKSHEQCAANCADDVQRILLLGESARKKAELYRLALAQLSEVAA